MKVLLAPDLHAWYEGPGPADARIEEWRRCARALVELATAERCSLALFPGDLWVSNRPSAAQVAAVIDLFRDLEAAGAQVVVIAGNHDVAAPGAQNYVDVLGRIKTEWGITEPGWRLVSHGVIGVACLPWVKGADDELTAIIRGMAAEMVGTWKIVLGHWATDASTYSSGEWAVGREPVLRLAELQSLPVDLVVLGHIHKPQVLAETDGPVILHTGALTRRDFGEADDERCCAVYDLAERRLTWHPIPARRFVTLDAAKPAEANLQDAYVRITYRATEEEAARFDHGQLIRSAQEAGACYVCGVYPEIIRSTRGRAQGLTEDTSPLEALERWLALRSELTAELRAEVRAAAEAVLREVA